MTRVWQTLSSYQDLFIVGLGGFLGAVARYSITNYLHQRLPGRFPIGTLVVNVLGCLLIGGLMAVFMHAEQTSDQDRHVTALLCFSRASVRTLGASTSRK